ncbi:hypothetical protein OSB04_013724 [Centaurea solstitialis]|uniref:UspA domain-containing protein n=1 Tax=Centaurea solstitialis TaxID=347529 RepID=A0AA38TDT5_9ASTR|nr:hypothetical protein OSB04_013724 [Centaurea solstitialis]
MEVERTGEYGSRRNTAEQPPSPSQTTEKRRTAVMVAVDESDTSLYALKWTIEHLFNKPTAGAVGSPIPATGKQIPAAEQGMITVVHVVQPFERYAVPTETCSYFELYLHFYPLWVFLLSKIPPSSSENYVRSAMYASSAMVESIRKAQRQNATELLSRALKVCKEMKIKAETLILEGNPKEMICQAVEEMHFDLLVVGSRGLGTIER